MPVIRSLGRNDSAIAGESSVEVAGEFEETVILKRWLGLTGGDDALMQAGADAWKSIKTSASLSALSAQEIATSGNLYAVGDLKGEFRSVVYGGESGSGDKQTAGRKADHVLYRGREYKVIGTPDRKFFGAAWFYEVVLRKCSP